LGSALGAPIIFIIYQFVLRQPDGLLQVGALSIAMQWKNSILLIPKKVGSTLLPIISKEKEISFNLAEYARSVAMATTLPIAIIIIFYSEWIFNLYGMEMVKYHNVLGGMAAVAAISGVGSGIASAIMANNLHWFGVKTNILSATLTLIIAYFATPIAGSYGAIMAFAIAGLVNIAITYYFLKSYFTRENIRQMISCIAISLGSTYAALGLIDRSPYTLLIIISVIMFTLYHWGFDQKTRLFIRKKLCIIEKN
jgi:O-antigen/teichoic acid export membrane protein